MGWLVGGSGGGLRNIRVCVRGQPMDLCVDHGGEGGDMVF